ncbi:MAG: glycosyltransferase family 4 protein [Candidatus Thorarchaeota archaeon]
MNLLLTFTLDTSLKSWDNRGILSRELALYRILYQKGVKISFLTYGDNSDLSYSSEIPNINIIPISKYINSHLSIVQSLKILFLPLRLKKIFLKADFIKTNQTLGGIVGVIAKLLYRKKYIVRAGYERLFNFMVKTKKKGIKNYIKYLVNYFKIYLNEFIVYRLADQIILTNEPDISFIIKRFNLKKKQRNNQIHLFYNFIDVNLFKPLNLSKKDKSVLYVGRLTYGKNLSNLINAFKNLDDYILDFIGNGPLEYDLRKLAEQVNPNINFLGLVSNEKLPNIINQYQLFIIPSYFEGNPKALLEAMSCGISCIGSNIKGINNIIQHKKNGYLCKLDSGSIRKAITTLYANHNLREEIADNARKFILENCELDSIVKKEYQLYKSILKK